MPFKNGYIKDGMVFNNGRFEHIPVEPKGNLSIKDIPEKFLEKHPVKVGDITPFTSLKIVE